MTVFKIVTNNFTQNKRYYIDSKRVSYKYFTLQESFCIIKGLRYNSSILYDDGIRTYNAYSYN